MAHRARSSAAQNLLRAPCAILSVTYLITLPLPRRAEIRGQPRKPGTPATEPPSTLLVGSGAGVVRKWGVPWYWAWAALFPLGQWVGGHLICDSVLKCEVCGEGWESWRNIRPEGGRWGVCLVVTLCLHGDVLRQEDCTSGERRQKPELWPPSNKPVTLSHSPDASSPSLDH